MKPPAPPPPLTLTVFDPATNTTVEQALPLATPGEHAQVALTRIPGGTGIHLRITENGEGSPRIHRMEIPEGHDLNVSVVVSWLEPGRVVARSPGRATYYLPSDPSYGPEAVEWIGGPVAPLVPALHSDSIDLAVLVDATARRWWLDNEQPMSDLLLAHPTEWEEVVGRILEIADGLAAGYAQVRLAILAFADESPALATPLEITPRFVIYPADQASRQLAERTPAEVEQLLIGIPASSGADYVDALAEGLQAAARLTWSPDARRILLVFGDSPGYSVLQPAPWGADTRVRTLDVDTEAARLHRRGVEVLTIFAGPPQAFGLEQPGRPGELLLGHTRAQYARLASTEGYAGNFERLVPEAMVSNVRSLKGPLARGATWPCFVKATAVSHEAARRLLG